MLNSQTYTIASTLAPHDRLSFYTEIFYMSQEIYRNTYLVLVQLCVNPPRMF